MGLLALDPALPPWGHGGEGMGGVVLAHAVAREHPEREKEREREIEIEIER